MGFFSRNLRRLTVCVCSAGFATAFTFGCLDVTKQAGDTDCKKWDYNWDKRDHHSRKKPKEKGEDCEFSTACRHILLIRHGQYNMGSKKEIERKLTPLGREQCEKLGQRLQELGYPYERIVVSTLTRARETAFIVSKHLPGVQVESCQFIHEGAPIQPEPPISRWKPPPNLFYEDGARIEAAFRKHFFRADPSQKKDSYEIFICHANVIRYFICRALQLRPEAWLRFSLHHCSITWLCIKPSGRVICHGIGDSGFLPSNMLTSNT
ncbi:PGAM5 [Cordylochernes scorpioides]|uniref:Serine/threonine-protein phosphatase PGAM5, mitochondrial n=1 Tax=Cordylochernes scorpioides TaxID=51811 RepID=A0ABY6L6G4_9ARAC|nr:PGAM5 [Cordylochernes scorpioides]